MIYNMGDLVKMLYFYSVFDSGQGLQPMQEIDYYFNTKGGNGVTMLFRVAKIPVR